MVSGAIFVHFEYPDFYGIVYLLLTAQDNNFDGENRIIVNKP